VSPLTITTKEHERLMAEQAHEYEKKLDALRVQLRAAEARSLVAPQTQLPHSSQQPPPKPSQQKQK
jgi:hypothetical protein